MIKYLLFCYCMLCLWGPSLQAQDLSINTLLKLRQLETPRAVHKKLAGKGWKMMSNKLPTEEKLGFASWAYKPVDSKATAWVHFFYSQNSGNNVIQFDADCNCAISKFEKYILKRKMYKLEDGERREEGKLLHTFTGYYDERLVIRLLTYPPDRGNFGIQILDKDYYLAIQDLQAL
jgi:hypothetical protein